MKVAAANRTCATSVRLIFAGTGVGSIGVNSSSHGKVMTEPAKRTNCCRFTESTVAERRRVP
jgi:hypothetical protein